MLFLQSFMILNYTMSTANIHFLAGLDKCKQEKYAEAIESFNQSLLTEPQHVESYFNRGLARFKLGQYQQAVQDYDKAIEGVPENAMLYSERAVAKHLLKDNRGAIADFNIALKLEPSNPYRYSSRAYVRAVIGDTSGAIEDYKKAIELDPEDAVAYNNLGLLEEKLGYVQKAKENFRKADAIADEGKTFEKPDLEDALARYEKKEQEKKETLCLKKQPKGTGEHLQEPSNPSAKEYFHVMKSVFTSKQIFSEFIEFIKYGWRKKN